MEHEQRIAELIARYRAGTCTETERALVDRVLFTLEEGETLSPEALRSKEAVWASLQAAISAERPVRRFRRWIPAAAAAVLALALGAWLLLVDSRQSSVLPTGQAGESLAATEILPGGNRATLTLADGRTITLDEAQAGIVIGDEGITYQDGSSLEAVMVSGVELSRWGQEQGAEGPIKPSLQNRRDPMLRQQAGAQNDALEMLTLTTPKGGTYQITLPDGSKVWLNAASTLKYPSRFSEDVREVFLAGEAFFEIKGIEGTRDTRAPSLSAGARVSRVPFIVQTSGQTVEVLGTEFNISAYADEPETKTTLVKGKVRVVGEVGAQQLAPDKSGVTLSPGQQATTRGAAITIDEVDIAAYTAWRDGTFRFDDTPLIDIMRQVSRWYDVEVDYSRLPDRRISGIVSRGERLSAVLRALEISSQLKFELQERRLVLQKE